MCFGENPFFFVRHTPEHTRGPVRGTLVNGGGRRFMRIAAIALYARGPPPTLAAARRRNIPSHFTTDYSCECACVRAGLCPCACPLPPPPETCTTTATAVSFRPPPTTGHPPLLHPVPGALFLSRARRIPSTHCTRRAVGETVPPPAARGALLSHNGTSGGHSIWLPHRWSSVARPFGKNKHYRCIVIKFRYSGDT